jgi:hypothetical protein
MSGAIPPLPQYAFMGWCWIKAQGQLYLYLSQAFIYETDRIIIAKLLCYETNSIVSTMQQKCITSLHILNEKTYLEGRTVLKWSFDLKWVAVGTELPQNRIQQWASIWIWYCTLGGPFFWEFSGNFLTTWVTMNVSTNSGGCMSLGATVWLFVSLYHHTWRKILQHASLVMKSLM